MVRLLACLLVRLLILRLATIIYLRERKQRYKLRMFQRLHYILIFVVFTIFAFFVVSSFAFSGRLAEGNVLSFFKSLRRSRSDDAQISKPNSGKSAGGC